MSPALSLFQAETEQKENFAAALAANRKALDESRQDRGSLRYEVDAKNRKAEALATELHLTETSLSERQAEVALLKGHERDYLQKIATLEVSMSATVSSSNRYALYILPYALASFQSHFFP